MKFTFAKAAAAAAALTFSLGLGLTADACSRAVYVGNDNVVITGRTMDWYTPQDTKLWIAPRGIHRNGGSDTHNAEWTSRYGSAYISSFNSDITDGINEKGLVVNKLYLDDGDIGNPGDKPQLNINGWVQYVLDNYSSVADAVEGLSKEPFRLIPSGTGSPSQLHLSLSDSTGDNAVIEYIKGELKIHHSKDYTVMTNEPSFDQQLSIQRHWEIKGENSIPGSSDSADRFTRLTYLLKQLPKELKPEIAPLIQDGKLETQALYGVMSIMRGISEPIPFATASPNNASTLWRTYYDHKNMKMYFDGVNSLHMQAIDLTQFDFSEGKPVLMLELEQQKNLPEDPSALFKEGTEVSYRGK